MANFKKTVAFVCAIATLFSFTGCANGGVSRADTLVFGVEQTPPMLDPARTEDGESSKVICNIFETLVRFPQDSTAKVEPCLAESWEEAKDGLSFTFKLRKDVKFHDGTDFNAEAVKFNFDRQLKCTEAEKAQFPYRGLIFNDIKEVVVEDPYTVKIVLTSTSATLLGNLAIGLGAPIASPKAIKAKNGNLGLDPVGAGTGPFKFQKMEKDQSTTLARNDAYWGEKAKVKNLVYRAIKDSSTRVAALKSGEVDVIDKIGVNDISAIEAAGNKVERKATNNISYMFINCDGKEGRIPNKPEVRKAIAQAVNTPQIVTNLYKGNAKNVATYLPSTMLGHNAGIKAPSYNAEEAKKVLAENNVKKVKFLVYDVVKPYNSVGGKVLAEAIAQDLRKVGVEAEFDIFLWENFKEKTGKGDYDIGIIGWNWDNGDPDNFLGLFANHQSPTQNPGRYNNPAYDELIAKGAAEVNVSQRKEIYAKAQQMLADEVPILPISQEVVLTAYRPNIKGFTFHTTGNIYFAGVTK